jgi:predicted ATPase
MWERAPAEMQTALERHDSILRSVIDRHSGHVFSTAGDAFAVAFATPGAAVTASQEIQGELAAERWGTPAPIRIRIGLHSGEAHERGGDYFGQAVNRAARLMAVAHGGQVVCSLAVASQVREELEAPLVDLGEHRLKDLLSAERIFQVGREPFPPVRSVGSAVHGLPHQRTPLVGRSSELARASAALTPGSIVTVVGPGGVGKTRLAIQAAAERADAVAGGAVLIDLSVAVDKDSLWSALAKALDLTPQGQGDPVDRLINSLAARSRVLVWDNCDQVLDQVAGLLESIAANAPGTLLIATSREPLVVRNEVLLRLGPLDLADGVELFVDCARRADVNVDRSGSLVDEICQALDGIPLAIELAAGRLRAVPLEVMAQLTSELFALLDGLLDDRTSRQRTLRATIDWSFGLLSPATQEALVRLVVLRGTFDVGAAAAVCDLPMIRVVEQLSILVDKSFVELGKGGRYRILEPLRQYSLEILEGGEGGSAEPRARHAAHFRAQASVIAPKFVSALHATATEQVLEDLPNFREALAWSLENSDPESAAGLAADLGWFWYHAGLFEEGLKWTARSLEASALSPEIAGPRATCQTALARLVFYQGDPARARQMALAAVESAASENLAEELGYALVAAATAAQALGEAAAMEEAQRAVDIFRTAGDNWGLATAAFYSGVAAIFLGQPELAAAPLEEAGVLFGALGDSWGIGGVNFYRGVLESGSGDRPRARELIRTSIDDFRRTRDRWRLMLALSTFADLHEAEEPLAMAARDEAGGLKAELGLG